MIENGRRSARQAFSWCNLRSWVWIGTIALVLAAFAVLTSKIQEAAAGSPEIIDRIDTLALEFAVKIRRPWLNAVAVDITALGSSAVLTLLVLVLVVLMSLDRKYSVAIHIAVAAIGAGLISHTMKPWFERPRPSGLETLVAVQGYSYPSGHSLSAAAVYTTLAILAWRLYRSIPCKIAMVLTMGIVIGLVGFSRTYLGVHYPSDVLAGILLGIAWALMLGWFTLVLKNRKM